MIKHLPISILLVLLFSCQPAYKNSKLSFEKRVDDLISRMTLDEKISQLMNESPAIPRLGIPAYNWWSEGLHGVARADYATVFPQAIGLAATFDDSLMFKIADIISTEFRAQYNKAAKGKNLKQYYGLTVWSPNVNIFRDPRWGRGQETYGEDPYLTSRMGVAFIKGLQGDDPKYFKTIATPKHFAVHSGPEPLRHVFNSDCSQTDLFETYTPAFKACITEGKAYSIMGAYNNFRGIPCCANNYLLDTLLRKEWGFEGYVVSDCDAIYDIYGNHKYVATAAEAASVGLKNGCDLECGSTYQALKEAVNNGFVTEAEIDVAVKRLFKARFLLGMFDPQTNVKYNEISPESVECQEHQQSALEASLKSMVLLKNNGILPLNKEKIRKIAVIGPNANKAEIMFGNYNGFPSKSITPLEGIKELAGKNIDVNYSLGCNHTEEAFDYNVVDSQMLYFDDKPGVYVQFYNNMDLKGTPVITRIEKEINFKWNSAAPDTSLNKDCFSARFRSILRVKEDGRYILSFTGDDGYRVYLNNELIMESWKKQAPFECRYIADLKKDRDYALKIEYYQDRGGASARLEYAKFNNKADIEAIKLASESDVIVFCGGISPKLEGEEMAVPYEGFDSGDRTRISLPEYQENYLKRLVATGKPVILVLMNGSALSINWANEHVAGIVESWYPGQSGGLAIAKILFGEYNPGGKLPVTFYQTEKDLPSFEDYNMKGRTYRYYNGPVLYPFGFGLSYTTFNISNATISKSFLSTSDSVDVSINVTNTGKMAGDEVVQLYIRNKGMYANQTCYKSLKRFKRITLEPGESKIITFKLHSEDFKYYNNEAGERIVVPGEYEILTGNSSADAALKSTLITIK